MTDQTADGHAHRRERLRDGLHATWEVFIVLLVCINLGLILFDSLFIVPPINQALAGWLPDLHQRYDATVHRHFQLIDLCFVAVFVFDVLLGWTVAIFERGTTTPSPTGTTCLAASR